MQSAAPELVDLSNETTKTLENYGETDSYPKKEEAGAKEMEIPADFSKMLIGQKNG